MKTIAVLALLVLAGCGENVERTYRSMHSAGQCRDEAARISRLARDSATLVLCEAAYDAMGARVDKLMADSVWIARHKCLSPSEQEALLREADAAWGIPPQEGRWEFESDTTQKEGK